MNIPWIHFHIREALGELRNLEALLECLETCKKGEWLSPVDDDRFCSGGKRDDGAIEIHLAASLAHAYHHMNFGWNTRRDQDGEHHGKGHFSKNENFPRPSEVGSTFDRFWAKRCLKCMAGAPRIQKISRWSNDEKTTTEGNQHEVAHG